MRPFHQVGKKGNFTLLIFGFYFFSELSAHRREKYRPARVQGGNNIFVLVVDVAFGSSGFVDEIFEVVVDVTCSSPLLEASLKERIESLSAVSLTLRELDFIEILDESASSQYYLGLLPGGFSSTNIVMQARHRGVGM